ncbi:MAG TPA: hopanoid biosynthesis-associated protein HpnK [Candidatus Baltobacteraceae bacterium]|nr:hopanoid biosynthesis-associated protein HpnK [Candidatus Baltobacteraceae bacterium]
MAAQVTVAFEAQRYPFAHLVRSMRQLIVTADDFGLAREVNEAVERGHREGILSTASLMVAAPATADAVERARRLPTLRVGLHVVLVNGTPALPPERIPRVVNRSGNFESDLFRAGVKYFFTPGVRNELEAEIRAQFERFKATGLPLDHVNAQNHFHVHPTVLSLIVKLGRDYGMRAIRIPREPFWPSWRAMGTYGAARFANAAFLLPWLSLMRLRLRLSGIATNDYVFGMNDTGHMTPQRVRKFLAHLPEGTSELYVHPATSSWPQAFPPDYDFAGEFAALVDPGVIELARRSDVRPITFSELAAHGE